MHSVDYKLTLTTDVGAEVFQREENRAAAEMPATKGGYNWVVQVPLKGLSPGRYVLAVEAEVTRQAVTIAYINDFRFMMYLSMLALPLLLLLRSPRRAANTARST